MNKLSNNILITGVSTGIGFGIAREGIRRSYRVFGSVRKQDDADRVQRELGAQFTPLIFDVTDSGSVKSAAAKLTDLIGTEGLRVLVNNSGIAIGGPLLYQPFDEIVRQFEVNVFGLLEVTRAFAPLLGATAEPGHPPGRIINISSVGGKFASPFVGAYVGSKHAVEGISASLRRELLLYGIDVIVVGPGAVTTPIWDKGIDVEPYRHTDYGRVLGRFAKAAMKGAKEGLSIERLGHDVLDIIEKKRPKTRYAIVPKPLSNWILPRLIPDRWVDYFIRKNLFKK